MERISYKSKFHDKKVSEAPMMLPATCWYRYCYCYCYCWNCCCCCWSVIIVTVFMWFGCCVLSGARAQTEFINHQNIYFPVKNDIHDLNLYAHSSLSVLSVTKIGNNAIGRSNADVLLLFRLKWEEITGIKRKRTMNIQIETHK